MQESNVHIYHGTVKVQTFDRNKYPTLKGDFYTMKKHPHTKPSEHKPISFWTYLHSLTTAERWLLVQLLNTLNYKNNTAKVIANTEVEKNYIKNGYKKLYEDGYITRVKRGHYMLNPVIKEVPSDLMVDIVLVWNTHCHPEAVIPFTVYERTTSYNMDLANILELLKQGEFENKLLYELQEVLNIAKELNWLDAQNQLTTRVPNNTPHFLLLLEECKKRGLI